MQELSGNEQKQLSSTDLDADIDLEVDTEAEKLDEQEETAEDTATEKGALKKNDHQLMIVD